jgi:cobyrinic acid a,c-diamide synthase
MPVYGECGGLMYLCGSLETDGKEYGMAGVLPGRAVMTKCLAALGYVKGTFARSAGLWTGPIGIRGHEFHYSRVECDRDARWAIRLSAGKGINNGNDGLFEHATVGAYTHTYFSDTFARRFVDAGAAWARR